MPSTHSNARRAAPGQTPARGPDGRANGHLGGTNWHVQARLDWSAETPRDFDAGPLRMLPGAGGKPRDRDHTGAAHPNPRRLPLNRALVLARGGNPVRFDTRAALSRRSPQGLSSRSKHRPVHIHIGPGLQFHPPPLAQSLYSGTATTFFSKKPNNFQCNLICQFGIW